MMGTGDLACYTVDGKQVWAFNLQDRYGKFDIPFGMTSTPVLDGDRLYLQLLHSGGALVVALDKATGKEIWKQTRARATPRRVRAFVRFADDVSRRRR